MLRLTGMLFAALSLWGCSVQGVVDDDGGAGGAGGAPAPTGLPILGRGEHGVASVELALIGDAGDQLNVPRDLEFHPTRPNELWVVNRADNAGVIFTDPGTDAKSSSRHSGPESGHFFAQPSALAMSDIGFFATAQETDELTQGNSTPPDFMGPTLWTSDSSEFDGGVVSHYDMLHNSPNGMGIAWQHSLVYWVFDGFHSSLTLYDFFTDHGPAGTDHTDGIIKRYVEGEVLWVENVPSHMQFDPPGGHLLYVADTGHSRIAVLDTTTGVQGPPIFPNYDGCDQTRVDGAILTTFVDGLLLDPPMTMPSGLAIHGGHVFVSDHASSIVYAFDMQGQLIDWLYTELPPGSLMGLTFDADGRLHFADALGNQIVRISALPESAD